MATVELHHAAKRPFLDR